MFILREKCSICGKSVQFAGKVFILQKKCSFFGKRVIWWQSVHLKIDKKCQNGIAKERKKEEEERGFIEVLFRTQQDRTRRKINY